ncbi:MAG: YceD family protein [Pseudomonadota bacterium]
MTDTLIPDYVDAKKIFTQQAVISGSLPVARFERFSDLLANTSGFVEITLKFFLNEDFRRVISGELKADVEVLCQRCLEGTTITLEDHFQLALVESDSQADKLPKDLEPWFCTDTKLVLADVVEEQLILVMPIVSYHQESCTQNVLLKPDTVNEEVSKSLDKADKPNPFAILQSLKKPR